MTTRRWMVVVAAVGLVMGWLADAIHLDQESARRLAIGARHSLKEYEARASLATIAGRASLEALRDLRRKLEYHARLKMKYWLMADWPRRPVEPDPPEPR
jgi:hypothetical protein